MSYQMAIKRALRVVIQEVMRWINPEVALHTLQVITLCLCAPSMLCVEHATCCLAFRGSRPVIGDQAYCNSLYFKSIRVLVI